MRVHMNEGRDIDFYPAIINDQGIAALLIPAGQFDIHDECSVALNDGAIFIEDIKASIPVGRRTYRAIAQSKSVKFFEIETCGTPVASYQYKITEN